VIFQSRIAQRGQAFFARSDMKRLFHWLLKILFRYEAFGAEALQTQGPVLLLPNHVSWVDWLFLVVLLDDDWKFVTSSVTARTSPLHRVLMINKHTFPIDPTSPYAAKRMAEFLGAGGRLVLFPEGRLSKTGTLMKIFDGTGFLLQKTRAQVIPCYLRGAKRILCSPNQEKKLWFPKVTAHFGIPVTPPHQEHASGVQARSALAMWLRDQLINLQFQSEMLFGPRHLLDAIEEAARIQPGKRVIEDISFQPVTYRRLMVGADLLSQALRKKISPQAHRIGVLLPNVNATPVVLMALWILGKVPAVLNFSTGTGTMLACLELAGIKQLITSRAFIERAKLQIQPFEAAGVQIIYLEEVRATIDPIQKLSTLARQILWLKLWRVPDSEEQTAVILFTSGSEGVPKGVELTHKNILANIRQMLAVTDLQDTDRLFTCLPMFHSFGLTVGALLPLVRGMSVFVYPSPLHYRVVPTAFYGQHCTVLLSTNTFLNGYARKAHPYDFRSMRYLFAAAEKLQEATAKTWSQRFGVRILEGYGATECAPCVAVNTPLTPKYGTVGRLMPGMEARLEPVEGVEGAGRLFVRGPNVMRGYLNKDANAKFLELDGWYDTGDIVSIDSEGFFQIQGRLKRFAKVSGEMVSLTAVEEALAGAFPQFGLRCQIAVVTRPDEEKGEALIAVTNEPKLQLDDLRAVIRGKSMTNLCVPREIRYLREIPKLGTGKTDHRQLQKIIEAPAPPPIPAISP
jgi:acyl-[acyl-carrier-protein]-phospholipid O-acyltransferase / long-chain-fatty-acid--[acyl-carrier-protein] ligase